MSHHQLIDHDTGIPGWFDEQNRYRLDSIIAHEKIESGIEIGCFLGLSTVWLALRLHRLQCVDTWRENATYDGDNNLRATLRHMGCPSDFYHVWESNVREFGVWEKVTPIRGRSAEEHKHVVDADLVYIDGDHSYEGVKRDIELYRPKARVVICGDDYVERLGFGVIRAVTELLPNHVNDGPFWWSFK